MLETDSDATRQCTCALQCIGEATEEDGAAMAADALERGWSMCDQVGDAALLIESHDNYFMVRRRTLPN